MNWMLKDFLKKFISIYLNNVIIYTKENFEVHLNHIKQVFEALR